MHMIVVMAGETPLMPNPDFPECTKALDPTAEEILGILIRASKVRPHKQHAQPTSGTTHFAVQDIDAFCQSPLHPGVLAPEASASWNLTFSESRVVEPLQAKWA